MTKNDKYKDYLNHGGHGEHGERQKTINRRLTQMDADKIPHETKDKKPETYYNHGEHGEKHNRKRLTPPLVEADF